MPILVVQLGHCYRKKGATGTPGEQPYATAVGSACRRLLHGRNGWTVRTILADDDDDLYAGDALVAVHCDGSTNSNARGASVGYRTPEGQRFGQAWKRAYAARGWEGFRPDNYTDGLAKYYGTRTAVARGNRRAIIVECGFLTNETDRANLTGPGGSERVALAIGDALGISTKENDVADLNLNQRIGRDSSVARQFADYQNKSGTLGHWFRGQRQYVAGNREILTAMATTLNVVAKAVADQQDQSAATRAEIREAITGLEERLGQQLNAAVDEINDDDITPEEHAEALVATLPDAVFQAMLRYAAMSGRYDPADLQEAARLAEDSQGGRTAREATEPGQPQ